MNEEQLKMWLKERISQNGLDPAAGLTLMHAEKFDQLQGILKVIWQKFAAMEERLKALEKPIKPADPAKPSESSKLAKISDK